MAELEELCRTIEGELALSKEVNAGLMPVCDNLESQLADMTKQRDELQEWKDSAMQVELSWDAQSVGKLLGFAIGSAIHPQIEPAIREIIKQRDGAFSLIEYAGELLGVTPQEHKSAHGFKVLQAIKDLIEQAKGGGDD
jgi:hypothetical protein